jgi:hypothetical protein
MNRTEGMRQADGYDPEMCASRRHSTLPASRLPRGGVLDVTNRFDTCMAKRCRERGKAHVRVSGHFTHCASPPNSLAETH